MKRSLFFILISLPILFFSCVGEDVSTEPIIRPLNLIEAPFSVIFDGVTGGQRGQLGIFTNLDDDEDIAIVWESSDETLLQIVNSLVKPVASKEDIGKKVLVSGKAYLKRDVSIDPTTSKITANSGASPIAELDEPFEVILGRLNLNRGGAKNIERTGIDVAEKVITGFDEVLEFRSPITSIDLNETEDIFLDAVFIDFQSSLKGSLIVYESSDPSILEVSDRGFLTPISKGKATITITVPNEFTDKDEALSESMEIEVNDTTVIIPTTPPTPLPTTTVIASGTFAGLPGYSAVGTFEMIEEQGKPTSIQLSDNFASGAPDLVIYLSNSLTTNAGALFISDTIEDTGAQTFTIPDTASQLDYTYVYLYCRRFGAPVGFAKIER